MRIKKIIGNPTIHDGVHESVYRSYHLLEYAKDLLGRQVPPDVVLEIITNLEELTQSTLKEMALKDLTSKEIEAAIIQWMEDEHMENDMGFCDCCGWRHGIERGDHFHQCAVEGMDDRWVCDNCFQMSHEDQKRIINERLNQFREMKTP